MPSSDGVEGRMFDNPISGERIVIRESGAHNGGRLLAFDLFLPPGGHLPPDTFIPSRRSGSLWLRGGCVSASAVAACFPDSTACRDDGIWVVPGVAKAAAIVVPGTAAGPPNASASALWPGPGPMNRVHSVHRCGNGSIEGNSLSRRSEMTSAAAGEGETPTADFVDWELIQILA